jgi:hypothetical protein
MELSMQQTVSHLLVSTRKACSIFEPNQLMHQNVQNCRAVIYGIEDLAGEMSYILTDLILMKSILLA